MYDAGPDGPLTFHGWSGTVASLSTLALVAGACTIAAGIWRSANGKSWLLVMNGLAFIAYGLIPLISRGPLRFDLFALLLVLIATMIVLLALLIAPSTRRHFPE